MRTAPSPHAARTLSDPLAAERTDVILSGGRSAWREYLLKEVNALLSAHYPRAVVLAEINELSADPARTIPNLESLVIRLRDAERTQAVIDRYRAH